VFDFSACANKQYAHMNDANPQAINEDYIRTWTLSSAPQFCTDTQTFKPTDRISVTVKRKRGGVVSNFLHQQAEHQARNMATESHRDRLTLKLNGIGGGFSCFGKQTTTGHPSVPRNMLWVAGGVGITPFMSMWDGIASINKARPDALQLDIVLVFAARGDDLDLIRHFLAAQNSSSIALSVFAYQSMGPVAVESDSVLEALRRDYPNACLKAQQVRFHPRCLVEVDALEQREVFLCGPDALMISTLDWLDMHGPKQITSQGEKQSAALKVHQEFYYF